LGGLDHVKCILSDESDYYPKFQQQEHRAVCEDYIDKANRPGPETDSHGNVIGESGPIIVTLDDPNKELSTTVNNHVQEAKTTRLLQGITAAKGFILQTTKRGE